MSGTHESTALLSNHTYDVIRNLSQRILPGLGTLYATIALLTGLPYSTQVVGICAAVALFLGVVMSASKSSFQAAGADGSVDQETGLVSFNDPSVLDKDTIVLTTAVKPQTVAENLEND